MPNTEPPPIPGQATGQSTSVVAKMTNVFVTPGEVFDEVKSSPPTPANWLTPLLVGIVMGIISVMVIYSQPQILLQLRQPGEQRIEKMVKEGKIPQKMADQQLAMMDRIMSPAFMKVMGIFSMLFVLPAMLFFVAMLFWLVCTFAFKARYDFMKVVEAVSLSGMIAVLGSVLMTLMAVIFQSIYMNVGPVLLLKPFDPAKPFDVLVQSINIMTLWYLAVLAMALARFSGARFYKAALWPFGAWAVMVAVKLAFIHLMAVIGGK